MNKLQQREKLLRKLISDCITFRLTETEALKYIEKEYGKAISSRNYYLIKSKLESEDSSQIWRDEFARIGFVQQFRKLFDDSIKIIGIIILYLPSYELPNFSMRCLSIISIAQNSLLQK